MPWYTKLFLKKLEKLQNFSWETCEMMRNNLQKNPEDFWNDVGKKSSKILKLLHRKFLISWNDPRIGKNL